MFDLCFAISLTQQHRTPKHHNSSLRNNSISIITFLTSFYLLWMFKPMEEDEMSILLLTHFSPSLKPERAKTTQNTLAAYPSLILFHILLPMWENSNFLSYPSIPSYAPKWFRNGLNPIYKEWVPFGLSQSLASDCLRHGQVIILANERWNKVRGGASGKVALLSWRDGLFLFLGFLQGRKTSEIWNCFCHLVIIRKIRLRKGATYKGRLSQENIKEPEPWSCCAWNGAILRVLMSSSKCLYC